MATIVIDLGEVLPRAGTETSPFEYVGEGGVPDGREPTTAD